MTFLFFVFFSDLGISGGIRDLDLGDQRSQPPKKRPEVNYPNDQDQPGDMFPHLQGQ